MSRTPVPDEAEMDLIEASGPRGITMPRGWRKRPSRANVILPLPAAGGGRILHTGTYRIEGGRRCPRCSKRRQYCRCSG